MNIVSRIFNSLAGEDIIDLYFVLSDLKDFPITEAEATETAYYNSMASNAVNENHNGDDDGIPLGKLVL